jgi:hypothetical protein
MDRDDVEVLTPNHFLITGPTGSFGQPGDVNIETLKKYHAAKQKHIDELWDRLFRSYISALRVQHNWDQKARPFHLKIGDFVMVPQEKILKTRWPIARITGFITSSSGQIKAAEIETYVSDRVNTRLKDELFGKRTRIKNLTPDQRRQVIGCFIPNKRPVLLTNLYPFEMWENTEFDFPVPIQRDSLPTNFPGHPVVLEDPLADFSSQKENREKRKLANREKARQAKEERKVRKRLLPEVDRPQTDRPRRKNARYDQNYRNLADGRSDDSDLMDSDD